MKTLQLPKNLLVIILIGFFVTSCSTEDQAGSADYTSVSFKLSSSSEIYNAVYLDVKELQVQVHENENDPKSWITMDVLNPGVYDFTDLNGLSELILIEDSVMPVSMIYNIKLVLGNDNAILLNNVLHAINTPGIHNKQSVNCVDRSLEANKSYEFTLRFELDNSIQINGMDVVLNPKMNTEMRTFQLY